MTTPIGAHIRETFPPMGNAMIDLGFIWVGFRIRLRDTLGNDLRVALLVASKLAV